MRCSHSAAAVDAGVKAFSASSRLFDLNGETNSVSKKQNSAIIVADVRRFCHQINTHGVFGTHIHGTLSGVFPHEDGKGFNVMLQALPIHNNGKIVLREHEAKDHEEDEPADDRRRAPTGGRNAGRDANAAPKRKISPWWLISAICTFSATVIEPKVAAT